MAIPLQPGDKTKRTKLHDRLGGRRQGGISPSRESANVFVITAERGKSYGYIYDGWSSADGLFHYTDEGQFGDQQMAQGNRAIRDHEIPEDARELHLFLAEGTELEYVGQFRCRDHYQADAPEANDGPARKVIVFRLEKLNGTQRGPVRTRLDRLGKERVKEISVEQYLTEETLVASPREPFTSERAEQKLVESFVRALEQTGNDVCRLQIRPDAEAAPIFCDIYDKTSGSLFEAKGTVTRQAIRMAIGQLADYSRFTESTTRRAILVPEKPRPDLMDLAASQGVAVIWQDGEAFAASEGSFPWSS
jgi:hypothetical protein